MITIDLSKQQALDPDQKQYSKLIFNGNLEEQSAVFFIIEEEK